MKRSGRKTIVVSTSVFLIGVGVSIVGAIVWKSLVAIVVPLAIGLVASVLIVVTMEGE